MQQSMCFFSLQKCDQNGIVCLLGPKSNDNACTDSLYVDVTHQIIPCLPTSFFSSFIHQAEIFITFKYCLNSGWMFVGISWLSFYPGLCGNFNKVQTDDFQTITGIAEHSASAFGNSWKTSANCADVQDNFEDPCLKSIVKGIILCPTNASTNI